MFKLFLGLVVVGSAVFLIMTGVGIILAIPIGLVGMFLAIWGFFSVLGGGAKKALGSGNRDE